VSIRNHLLRLIAVASLTATPALAADQPVLPPLSSLLPLATKAPPVADVEYFMPQPVSAWQAEFAARYWFGEANTGKTLYGPPSVFSGAVSRLTYRNLLTNSGDLARHAAGRRLPVAGILALFEHDERAAQRLSELRQHQRRI
jgi:hypothetical protein